MADDFAETVRRNLHPEYNSLPLAEALIAVDKVLAERDRYRLAWQSARKRAGIAKSAWRYQQWRLDSIDGEMQKDFEFQQFLWGELAERRKERDRYRAAWKSARQRAEAYGEGILRITAERNDTSDELAALEETAAEQQQNALHWQEQAEQLAFIHAVLQMALDGDFRSELLWRSDGQRITVSVDVSDVFAWASADAEDLTPERLPLLAQALADLKAVHPHDDMYTVDLYAARIRQMRPQGAAYPKERAATQALFDACGPERATGLGNPRKPPTPTEDGQP